MLLRHFLTRAARKPHYFLESFIRPAGQPDIPASPTSSSLLRPADGCRDQLGLVIQSLSKHSRVFLPFTCQTAFVLSRRLSGSTRFPCVLFLVYLSLCMTYYPCSLSECFALLIDILCKTFKCSWMLPPCLLLIWTACQAAWYPVYHLSLANTHSDFLPHLKEKKTHTQTHTGRHRCWLPNPCDHMCTLCTEKCTMWAAACRLSPAPFRYLLGLWSLVTGFPSPRSKRSPTLSFNGKAS